MDDPADVIEPEVTLPEGVTVGHSTDRDAWTGCTVILGPEGTVSAGEVRGGGPGTREFDLLSPASTTPGAQALLLAGGSAFGLGAADGVVGWMRERGQGYPTPAGLVPLVSAAICYDLAIGSADAWPGPDQAREACEAADTTFARGCVGAGTGCTVGKVLGDTGWTKSGLGAATVRVGEATLTAIAVVNAFGEVVGEDGQVLAGPRGERPGQWRRTLGVLTGGTVRLPDREATTLVCLVTDAAIDKTAAWRVARAAAPGFGRAVTPVATPVDGDLAVCMATGRVEVDPMLLPIFAAEVTAAAIRDGVRSATDGAGVPAASSWVA